LDPYKNFNFLIEWDMNGTMKTVAGMSKMSVLKRTTQVVEHRSGGDVSTTHKSPGQIKFDPITFERGLTHDPEFEKWANKVWNYGSGLGAEVSLLDFRKDILVKVLNEAGQVVLVYKVYRCWISTYTAFSDLDASANAVLIESIVVENEGFERDDQFPVPKEPKFD
jgi:phage tail-like protein